jgi:hypothetical protein
MSNGRNLGVDGDVGYQVVKSIAPSTYPQSLSSANLLLALPSFIGYMYNAA